MTKTQRTTFIVLLAVGLIYIGLFFLPNSFGAGSDEILLESSGDEYVTYPNVVRILTPGKTFNETRANLFLYEDYHYGYPFYAYSALVLLPVRLLYGSQFTQHMQLNLLLLRQFTNVLPMVIAAGLLVFLQTRFLSLWKSLALFLILLSIRGVVRSHIWWWHPDSLTVLFIVLTIFFLERDRFRLGKFFYLAAIACGLATSIKLMGVFFFLTIPVYLFMGFRGGHFRLQKAFLAGFLFVVVMAFTVVVTNPFLFSDEQRERMLLIQQQKREELSQGYSHDDPTYYQKGPQWWASTLEKWYAPPLFLALLVGLLAAGTVWGSKQLLYVILLTWIIPYSIYVLYFVAVKPDHYWLPVMLPLFSCSLLLIDLVTEQTGFGLLSVNRPGIWRRLALVLGVVILTGQFVLHLFRPVSGNIAVYQAALTTGMEQLQKSPNTQP